MSQPSARGAVQPLFSAPPFATRSGFGSTGSRVGLVLSGGGVRGAYEAGVVRAIVQALGLDRTDPAPFGIFAGSSVGAINAAFLASHADRGDLCVRELESIYRGLDLREHLRVNWEGLAFGDRAPSGGASILDPRPLEALVRTSVRWTALHDLVARGNVRALVVAALDLAEGRTTVFSEAAPSINFRFGRDSRRSVVLGPITADHVLASAAIPLVFPARRVGDRYYSDGGIQFNTPLSPAIRAGATKLVVISVGRSRTARPTFDRAPGLGAVVSRLVGALLVDPIQYELGVLSRLNRLLDVMDMNVDANTLMRIQQTLIETRGAPYRPVDLLEFRPSADLNAMAHRHVRRLLGSRHASVLARRILAILDSPARAPSDWPTYLLFDGTFAGELAELGYADGLARESDVLRFFGEGARPDVNAATG